MEKSGRVPGYRRFPSAALPWPHGRLERLLLPATTLPAPVLSRVHRGVLVALALVAVAAVLRGVAWASALPAWQGPDETAHYAYVERLAHGALPLLELEGHTTSPAVRASHDASAYWSFRFREASRPLAREEVLPEEARLSTEGHGAGGASVYPPTYYLLALPAYLIPGLDTATGRLFAVRLLSALLAGVLVVLTFALVREAVRHDGLALAGATLVALPPMVGQASGTVNPDILLAVALTGVALGLVQRVNGDRGPGPKSHIALWGALAVAAKPVGMVAAGALVAAFLVVPAVLRSRRAAALLTAAAASAGLAATVAAIVGGERIRSPYSFAVRYAWDFYLPRLPSVTGEPTAARAWSVWVEGGVGSFGWLSVWLPTWAYWLALASVVVAAGVAVAGLRRDRLALPLVLSCLVGAALYLALLHVAELRLLLVGQGRLLQGRYLIPIIPLAVCAFLAAVAPLPARARSALVGGTVAVWALLSLLALGAVVDYFAS